MVEEARSVVVTGCCPPYLPGCERHLFPLIGEASVRASAAASEAAKFEPLNFSGGRSRQGIDAHQPFGEFVMGKAHAQEIL